MLPYRIWDYPVPALMPLSPPRQAAGWPAQMDRQVREFDQSTSGLARTDCIYIHLPFCPFHCSFCGYYTKISKGTNSQYMDLLEKEICLYADHVPAAAAGEYRHVLFGGGTPSQHTAEDLIRVLDRVRERLPVARDAEITVEGIAEQMLRDGFLRDCSNAGFTRVAFGVQSLEPRVRRAIGRGKEDVSAFPEVVRRAQELGIAANVELMMACPEQTIESLRRDLYEVVSWNPASIDVTAYVPIPGTNLYKRIVRGNFDEEPEPDLSYGQRLLVMRQLVTATLGEAGYPPARPECYSRGDHRFDITGGTHVGNGLHAQLAFGPSAHGQLGGTAFSNIADLDRFSAAVNAGLLPIERAEQLTLESAVRRSLLNALSGLFIPSALVTGQLAPTIESWLEKELVQRSETADGYFLTERGFHWQNQLQMEVLGKREAAKCAQLIGSLPDQIALTKNGSGIGRELLEQAGRGESARLRRA
jgi:coproporphyrinogen III oxidase-like Fe-S oxidoreductase